MRKLVLSIHMSLDGFVGGLKGEINWIRVDQELFDFITPITDQADTALYGRITYQMMESYWPTAADKPAATKHDREHSQWYKNVTKIILSKTLHQSDKGNTIIVSDNVVQRINAIKKEQGKNILMLGSPSAAQILMQQDLVDEYWLFINPIILGNGIPFFTKLKDSIQLKLAETKIFSSGVIGVRYIRESTR
jgi:dihydrofolate reductase